MNDAGREPALLREVAERLGVVAEILVEDLDRDIALGLEVERPVDRGGRTEADRRQQLEPLHNTLPESSSACTSDRYAVRMLGSGGAFGGVHKTSMSKTPDEDGHRRWVR
jgi:hypothetical protein